MPMIRPMTTITPRPTLTLRTAIERLDHRTGSSLPQVRPSAYQVHFTRFKHRLPPYTFPYSAMTYDIPCLLGHTHHIMHQGPHQDRHPTSLTASPCALTTPDHRRRAHYLFASANIVLPCIYVTFMISPHRISLLFRTTCRADLLRTLYDLFTFAHGQCFSKTSRTTLSAFRR